MEVPHLDPLPSPNRIKRKPPPRLDITERYPPPDPNDPFAPLSVLRSRSSALLGFSSSQDNLSPLLSPTSRASFQLYPAAPLNLDDPFAFQSRRDSHVHGDLASPTRSPITESHYRRRSQSVMGQYNTHQYSVTLPKSAHKSSPSRDMGSDSSGTDVEGEAAFDGTRPTSPTPDQRIGTHGRISHFFTPHKKPSQMSINSISSNASSSSKTPTKRSHYSSTVSSPASFPASPEFSSHSRTQTSTTRNKHRRWPSYNTSEESFRSARDNEGDHGYYSQPEISNSRPFSPYRRSLKQSLGSSLTKCSVIPDLHVLPSTPLTPAIPVPVLEGPSVSPSPARSVVSLHSSSSYVDVSLPSSLAGHGKGNSHPEALHSPELARSPSRLGNRPSPEANMSPSLSARRASLQPSFSPSTVASPNSPPSSATAAYKFSFRRIPAKTAGNVASRSSTKSKSSSRSMKISNPTLISPAPAIPTKDLPSTLSPGSAHIKHKHTSSNATHPEETTIGSSSGPSPSTRTTSPLSPRKQETAKTISGSLPSTSTSTATSSTPELALPTDAQLARAASLPLITESGVRISFGSLFSRDGVVVVVIFIRHFWCPFDQDYVQDLVEVVKYNGINYSKDDVQLVIISNGSHTLIAKYRQIFKMPGRVEVFTDPTLRLYKALGMRMVGESMSTTMTANKSVSGQVGGGSSYVKRGMFGGMATVVMRALKVGMYLWEKGGESRQLGGEFVFRDGTSCIFAHRMRTKHDHVPISDIFRVVGESSSSSVKCISIGPSPPPAPAPPQKRVAKVVEEPEPQQPSASTTDPVALALQRLEFRISNHPYAYNSHSLPVPYSTSLSKHARRRSESLTSTDVRLRAAARRARVRASTIWTMDVKGYDFDHVGDGHVPEDGVEESESERWKRNLISLRAELAGEKVSTRAEDNSDKTLLEPDSGKDGMTESLLSPQDTVRREDRQSLMTEVSQRTVDVNGFSPERF